MVEPEPQLTTPASVTASAPDEPLLPPAWPPDDPDVRAAITACVASGDWGRYHGRFVPELEQRLAEYHGVPHALTVCSGTFAVELALRALRIGAGDEVLLAGYDFPGNFRGIEAVGARPVVVDIDPRTWCLDPGQVALGLSAATRAVIVSHLHGGLADLEAIRQILAPAGVALIEDACQAPGAWIEGRPAGSWGDVGVLSFGGSKLLTAGRGGAILTASPEIAQRARIYCDRGNHAFPLSELQAAALVPQLEKLDARNALRQQRVQRLRAQLADLVAHGLVPVAEPPSGCRASYYKHAWRWEPAADGPACDEFANRCRAAGVAIDRGFRGFVGRSDKRCRRVGDLLHARRAAQCTVLLHHPLLLLADESLIDRAAVIIRSSLISTVAAR